ncbi:MAG: acetyltransferase [Frondihabitans sp.]|nr:acetyltransferase [Frondihabitans sp.]
MAGKNEIAVRDVEAADAAAWAELYTGYRDFYELPRDADAVARIWSWVLGRQHSLRGLVVVGESGELVALANLRLFARPSSGTLGLYLDDLFTAPAARGSGAGRALLGRAAEIAAEEGATVVRWITAASNATARRLYDAHATATPWVTYDMRPAAPGS